MNQIFSLPNILSEFKYSIRLALPLIASEVIYMLSSFIATIMVAHLGKEQLAANALVWEIFLTILVFFIGIFCSVSIMVSQSVGAKDDQGISICFKQGLIMAIIFALPMMLFMWLAPIALIWTGQDHAVIKLANPFFQSLIWTMLPLNIMFVVEQFLIGVGKTRMVTLMSILIVPIQVIFYYVFLFGKFGLPKLGLSGIGHAMTISYCLATVFFFCYLGTAKQLKTYHLFRKWWIVNKKFLLELIRIGIPLDLTFAIEVGLFAVIAIMMGTIGTTALAAHQIAYQYFTIALAFLFGLTQTVTVRVGNEVGCNNRNALKLSAIVNMGIGLGFMMLFSIFYIFFPHVAIGLDIDIHAPRLQGLLQESSVFLSIAGILILIDCVRLISSGALRGLKDTRFPMLVSTFGFWCVGLPCSYLLAFKLGFGGAGIWWGLVIGLATTGVILFTRFNHMAKHIDLVSLVTRGSDTDCF